MGGSRLAGIDAFTVIIGGMLLLLILALAADALAGGRGRERDRGIQPMLDAQNERRRRKGLPDRTEAQVQAEVAAFEREMRARGELSRARRGLSLGHEPRSGTETAALTEGPTRAEGLGRTGGDDHL